ncbi:hypothetical protein B0H34DRAFT_695547 [Crassisporium funariophilum]|nr:hypothetical protein B0H34DRAFT_695547 [Crassisporium funariophilum]
MLTHRGFSAWITSNNEEVPEYLVAVDEKAHCVSCWIPGTEGQTFTVYWSDNDGKVDTCTFITLDGMVVPGRFLLGNGTSKRSGVRTSETTERPFMFRKVEDPASGSSSSKEAGMITLKVKRIKRLLDRPANSIRSIPDTILGKRKAGELCVGFGQEYRVQDRSPSTWAVIPYDQDVPGATKPRTFVSFVFRYRSREFLESQGIAPPVDEKRPPPPPKALPPAKRMASLPPHALSQPELSLEPPLKKPRLMPQTTLPFPTSARRPSAELRRTASWTATQHTTGGYEGEAQFFLPRNFTMPAITSIRPPGSGTSTESPDTGTDDSTEETISRYL